MRMTATALAIVTAISSFPLCSAELSDAFYQGKTSLVTRLRYENVDDANNKVDSADSLTNRLTLGFKTAEFYGLGSTIEFENVTSIGDDNYNSGTTGEGNAKTDYPLIADPELTQVNQAFLSYKGLQLGRQKLVLDNARFVGDVGWRQNDQTFDALTYSNKSLIPMTQFSLAYLNKVHTVFGADRDLSAPLINVRISPNKAFGAALFHYAVEEEMLKAASWKHSGARVDGEIAGFLYDASFAKQSDYKDSATLDADYHDIQLGYKFKPITVMLQQEVLEKGFKTPFATLHAFNGWADRFVPDYPADGLKDSNIKLTAQFLGVKTTLGYFKFETESTGVDLGTEVDLSVAKKFTEKLNGLVKYARYSADDKAPAKFGKDTDKFWLQMQYSFL